MEPKRFPTSAFLKEACQKQKFDQKLRFVKILKYMSENIFKTVGNAFILKILGKYTFPISHV